MRAYCISSSRYKRLLKEGSNVDANAGWQIRTPRRIADMSTFTGHELAQRQCQWRPATPSR